jgi:hypothetical protein
VGADDDGVGDEGNEGGDEDDPPALSPALFDLTFALKASLDGIDDDGSLPLEIEEVCGVPAHLASDASKLAQGSGAALLSDDTQIGTCGDPGGDDDEDAARERGTAACEDTPAPAGTRLHGDEALSTLDEDADTAFLGVRLVPRAEWLEDEDGDPVPTFEATWVKITD